LKDHLRIIINGGNTLCVWHFDAEAIESMHQMSVNPENNEWRSLIDI
jgi:hypothetical protein